MNDIRAAAGQDVITEIIPMENQDGITSDVQVDLMLIVHLSIKCFHITE